MAKTTTKTATETATLETANVPAFEFFRGNPSA